MRESFENMIGKNNNPKSPSIEVDESDIMADNSNPDVISAEENDYDPTKGKNYQQIQLMKLRMEKKILMMRLKEKKQQEKNLKEMIM